MTLRFSAEAQGHIADIYRYIGLHNSVAAIAVIARIKATTELLVEFPRIGREGTVSGTSELVVKGLPYIIVYEVREARREIIVLGVFHGAQER